MRCLATPTAILPEVRLIVVLPSSSVIVSTDSSRMVTIALPPISTLTMDCSPVWIRSRSDTASLNFRGSAPGPLARATLACPCSVVTTPSSGAWAQDREGEDRVGSTRNAIVKRNRRLFIADDDRALVVRAQARDRVSAGESGRGDSGRAREGRAEGQNEASGQLEADSGARTCQGIDTIAFSRLHLGINFPYATIAARRGASAARPRRGPRCPR